MGKWANDNVMDAACAEVATSNLLIVCAGQPIDRADALAKALAQVAMTPGDGNGSFVISNGDISGRKVRTLQQSDLNIDSSGDADHIALCDATELNYVTTAASQTLTAGGTVTVPAWDGEIADPS